MKKVFISFYFDEDKQKKKIVQLIGYKAGNIKESPAEAYYTAGPGKIWKNYFAKVSGSPTRKTHPFAKAHWPVS